MFLMPFQKKIEITQAFSQYERLRCLIISFFYRYGGEVQRNAEVLVNS